MDDNEIISLFWNRDEAAIRNLQKEYGDELSSLISEYLSTLKQEQRVMFVKRYWYAEKIKTIAQDHHCSAKKVESVLLRTRRNLKKYLTERGYLNE